MGTLRKLIDALIFILVLALIVGTNIPYGTVDAWWEALFEVIVFGLTALWVIEALLRGGWELKRLAVLLPLLLLVAYMFGQIVIWPSWVSLGSGHLTSQRTLTIDRYQTYLTARKTLALTLFFGLLLQHVSNPKRLRWLVRVLISLGLASALFGILRQLIQVSDSPEGFILPFLFYGMGYGQYLYHNLFSYLMEMTFALTMGLLLGGAIQRDRVLLYTALMLPIWASLVLSESRGGVLSLVCQIIFLVFMALSWFSKDRVRHGDAERSPWLSWIQSSPLSRVAVIASIVIILAVSVFWMGGDSFASRVSKMDSEVDVLNHRTRREVWRESWQLIKANPWGGVGFGAYFLAIPQFETGAGTVKLEQAHNDYIDLAANGGLVAIALVVWFVILMIGRIRKNLRSRDVYRRAACLGAAAGIISVAAHSLVDFGLQVTGIAVVFFAIVVLAIADERVVSHKPITR